MKTCQGKHLTGSWKFSRENRITNYLSSWDYILHILKKSRLITICHGLGTSWKHAIYPNNVVEIKKHSEKKEKEKEKDSELRIIWGFIYFVINIKTEELIKLIFDKLLIDLAFIS